MASAKESHTCIALFASFYVGSIVYFAFSLFVSTIILTYFTYMYLSSVLGFLIKYALGSLACTRDNGLLSWSSMLCLIGERVQGIWYLVEGPSSLQSGYTRVSFYFLWVIDGPVLTLCRGPRRMVQASDSIK